MNGRCMENVRMCIYFMCMHVCIYVCMNAAHCLAVLRAKV